MDTLLSFLSFAMRTEFPYLFHEISCNKSKLNGFLQLIYIQENVISAFNTVTIKKHVLRKFYSTSGRLTNIRRVKKFWIKRSRPRKCDFSPFDEVMLRKSLSFVSLDNK